MRSLLPDKSKNIPDPRRNDTILEMEAERHHDLGNDE